MVVGRLIARYFRGVSVVHKARNQKWLWNAGEQGSEGPKDCNFFVKSQNIVKVKGPDCFDMNATVVMKGIDDVVLLMPFSSHLRVQSIKGGF
jgi:hypothetical protein